MTDSTTKLPEPLVSIEVDLRDFGFMPLHVQRLRDSELVDLSTGDEFKAAVLLWAYAWHQQPAASIPDDDRILAKRSGANANWPKVKEMALRGFVKCSDGRLYHPLIAEAAADAWRRRGEYQETQENREDRKRRYQERLKELSAALRELGVRVPKDRSIEVLERTLEEARRGRDATTPRTPSGDAAGTPGDASGDTSGDTSGDACGRSGDALDRDRDIDIEILPIAPLAVVASTQPATPPPPDPPAQSKARPLCGLKAWLAAVKAAGEKPIPDDDAVFAYADSVDLPRDFLHLAWIEFRHAYTQPDARRYRDWRAVFRKAVRQNWLKLWYLDGKAYALTTVGQQARLAREKAA